MDIQPQDQKTYCICLSRNAGAGQGGTALWTGLLFSAAGDSRLENESDRRAVRQLREEI